jgi:hypothetical protein
MLITYQQTTAPIKVLNCLKKHDGVNEKIYQMLGNCYDMNKEPVKAIESYEKGIEVQPAYSSNYYRAAKIYLNTTDEIWGMIYGELFMNIEWNSQRKKEISKMLFNTYKNEIKFTSDSSFSLSLSQNHSISMDDLADTNAFKLPFGLLIYEPGIMISMINEKSITLSQLKLIK